MQGPYDQRFLFDSRARKNFYQDDAIRFFSINNKKTWFLQLKAVKNYTQNGVVAYVALKFQDTFWE